MNLTSGQEAQMVEVWRRKGELARRGGDMPKREELAKLHMYHPAMYDAFMESFPKMKRIGA